MTFNVDLTIDMKTIRGLLCNAFEGGSNYWYEITRWELGAGHSFDDFKEGGKQQPKDNYWHWSQLIPTTPDCAILITDREDDSAPEYRLDMDAIERGLQVMADNFPNAFAEILTENDDSETGDILLQCCLFEDVIYG